MNEKAIQEAFGKKVKAYREARKLTREQLAEEMDVTPSAIYNIEAGMHFVSIVTLVKYCIAFNTTPSDLFSLADEAPAKEDVLSKTICLQISKLNKNQKEFLNDIIKGLKKL